LAMRQKTVSASDRQMCLSAIAVDERASMKQDVQKKPFMSQTFSNCILHDIILGVTARAHTKTMANRSQVVVCPCGGTCLNCHAQALDNLTFPITGSDADRPSFNVLFSMTGM
jgi:hypothetical protein